MKCFSIISLAVMSMLLVSACAAQAAPPPTVNAVELQGTMAAAALTMVADTQAAVPTATPLPPTATLTDTPAVTNTVPPLPPGVTLTPVANNGAGDDCVNNVLPETLHGKPIKVRINNGTEATMRVSVYLNRNGPQGQCGYRAFNLEPGQFMVMDDLVEGCYTLFAWNIDPDEYFIVNNGTDCLDNSATWIFDISTGDIRLRT